MEVSTSDKQQTRINEVHIDDNMAGATRTTLSDLSDSQHDLVVDIDSINCKKGWRSSGSTNYDKQKQEQEIVAIKNDIANKHKVEYFLAFQSGGKRVPMED